MKEAEKYLVDRLNKLLGERNELTSKIEEAELEIEEIRYKVKELEVSIDEAFEIFSPRAKRNDYVKSEIESLERKISSLEDVQKGYKESEKVISEEIKVIAGILGYEDENNKEDYEDDDNEGKEILDGDILSNSNSEGEMFGDDNFMGDEIIANSDINVIGVSNSSEYVMGNENLVRNKNINISTMEGLTMEKERRMIGKIIEEKTLQSISNLIYKCDICSKLLEVDSGRTKLEIEVMSKNLNELYSNIEDIVNKLKRGKNDEVSGNRNERRNEGEFLENRKGGGKISVKKLSKDNFNNGNL